MFLYNLSFRLFAFELNLEAFIFRSYIAVFVVLMSL